MNRENFVPSPPAAVEARAADGGRWTLVFVRDFDHAPEKLWDALTDPAQLAEWAPFTSSRNLGREGDATLTMVDAEERVDLPAEVRRAERPALLEYTWGNPDDEVPDVLRWELTPTETGTRLTLHHTVGDQELLGKVAAGWHLCLDVAACFLAGTPLGAIRGADALNYGWQALHDEYADLLG